MKQQITDEGDPRKYWTQIPNIVFELGLKPLELVLYAHMKRAASTSGRCTKSTATLARETGMGAGTVSRTKTALEAKRSMLGNKPLIRTREIANPRGGKAFQEITITDIWKVNGDYFASSSVEVEDLKPSSSLEIEGQNQVPVEVDPSSKPSSTVEIKKNSKKNNEEEQERNFISELKTNPLYAHVDFDREFTLMRQWLDRPANSGRRMTERFVLNWLNKIDRPVHVAPSGISSDRAAREAELRKKMGWDKLEQRTA
jgi:hypothetical protein